MQRSTIPWDFSELPTEHNTQPLWCVSWNMRARPSKPGRKPKTTGNSWSSREKAEAIYRIKAAQGRNPVAVRRWVAGWAF